MKSNSLNWFTKRIGKEITMIQGRKKIRVIVKTIHHAKWFFICQKFCCNITYKWQCLFLHYRNHLNRENFRFNSLYKYVCFIDQAIRQWPVVFTGVARCDFHALLTRRCSHRRSVWSVIRLEPLSSNAAALFNHLKIFGNYITIRPWNRRNPMHSERFNHYF